ncbi:GntR family transcriptional regulator [Paeniglutamicibacter terrestris]|uniref:GntR family transcriptional regulator n=1 Tax=Paeniglutamicibacter terrestris TaxID=2723403 RepID=A0ABX1G1Y3_9MICC|nr:GntR family transcriptional regulator [Paeniglutamicibacter terrestris]NKG19959.1 GntR family transcriptional regulator [Paeniglutamicibacter terrestris]
MSHRVTALSIIDAIVQDLRRRIYEGDIAQGTALTEAEVASTYEVARPTAKAAIERLVADSLLERGAHKTARVKTLGADSVRDIYFARAYLESEVVRRLATTKSVPAAAVHANAEISARISLPATTIIGPDMDFHTALVDAMDNTRTSAMYRSLLGEVRLCMTRVQSLELLDSAKIASEHATILERIAAGDPEGAAIALDEHLAQARELLAAEIEQASDLNS